VKEKVIGKNPTIQQIIEWAEQNGFYGQFRLVEKSLPNKACSGLSESGAEKPAKVTKSKVSRPAKSR